MNSTPMTRAQRRSLEKVAKSLVESCVRNALEDVHAGVFPGEIPWARLGRISDEEMKLLMIDIVNKTYTFLRYLEELAGESAQCLPHNAQADVVYGAQLAGT